MNIKYVIVLLIAVLIAAVSQLLLKLASSKKYNEFIYQYLNVKVIAAYFLLFLSSILTITAYRGIKLKYGPIIQSTGYIFILFLSNIFMGEKLTRNKLIGVTLIIIGIIIFSR